LAHDEKNAGSIDYGWFLLLNVHGEQVGGGWFLLLNVLDGEQVGGGRFVRD